MNIRLIHPARHEDRFKWDEILSGVADLAEFEKNLRKGCNKDIDYLTETEQGKKIRTYLGDAWEVFVEMLIKSHPYDRRVGISAYTPCHPGLPGKGQIDMGVDGYGTGTNLRPATVQSKFRSKATDRLTSNGAHLVNFAWTSTGPDFGVLRDDTDNMLVVTNCAGLHYFTEGSMLDGKVRCLNRDHIKDMVDNNLVFWEEFRNATKKVAV